MNQAELVAAIHANVSQDKALSKADVNAVLTSLNDVVKAEIYEGGEVTLPGIGKLSVKERAARKGRNPQTGAEIDIPAKKVVDFSPSLTLRQCAEG